MSTAAEPKRGPIGFTLNADDERLVIIMDENHPLYDERVHIPLEDLEGLALSLANGGQQKSIIVRKNGELFEVVDGRQEVRAARWANDRIRRQDPRFAFRSGIPIELSITARRYEDDEELVEAKRKANASIKDTPGIRARNVKHDLKFVPKNKLAASMGVTEAYLDEILSYFDMDIELQKEVDSGGIKETVAREMVKRTDGKSLTREEQRETLQEMKDKGATKGAKAKAVIRAKKTGRKVNLKDAAKMRDRGYIERFYDELKASGKGVVGPVMAFIDHILRRKGDINSYPALLKVAEKLSGAKAESRKKKGAKK